MIRAVILLAISSVSGACNSGQPGGNSVGADNEIIAAGAVQARAGNQIMDRGAEPAARALVQMLPLTIEMTDHLRQEKTGNLPSSLPEARRQVEFSAGTLGLWGDGDLVIYYRAGRVPRPGIVLLGQLRGNISIFEGNEPVTVQIRPADRHPSI